MGFRNRISICSFLDNRIYNFIFVLAHHNTISYGYAIILTVFTVFTIIIAVIELVFIYLNTSIILSSLPNEVLQQLTTNWNENGDMITSTVQDAYSNCNYCTCIPAIGVIGSTAICVLCNFLTYCGRNCRGTCLGSAESQTLDEFRDNNLQYIILIYNIIICFVLINVYIYIDIGGF